MGVPLGCLEVHLLDYQGNFIIGESAQLLIYVV